MSNSNILARLDAALAKRREADPAKSYTASLYAGGTPAIADKITEEAAEVVEAAGENDDAHLIHEVADLWFHTMVLLQSRGLDTQAVQAELGRRFGVSGIEEKAARGNTDTPAN
jgi:phosphoribosyl-ATP pyrophosphohydrolase